MGSLHHESAIAHPPRALLWHTVVSVVVRVVIVCGANVVHVVYGTALHAAGLGLIAGEGDPKHVVRVGWEAGATDVLLVTGRVDGDRVLHRACRLLAVLLYHVQTTPS